MNDTKNNILKLFDDIDSKTSALFKFNESLSLMSESVLELEKKNFRLQKLIEGDFFNDSETDESFYPEMIKLMLNIEKVSKIGIELGSKIKNFPVHVLNNSIETNLNQN